jgi:hypothetical protein
VGLATGQAPAQRLLPGRPRGELCLVGGLPLGLGALELLRAAGKPRSPRAGIAQLCRQLVAAALAQPLILGGVGLGGLAQHPLCLRGDRLVGAGGRR